VSEREDEALEELREIARQLRSDADQSVYGFICVEDPNDFSPDPECSTDEERERHRAACEQFKKTGKDSTAPGAHCAFMNGGKEPPGYGMGMNSIQDEEKLDWADRIERCIARLEP